ncbi:HAD family hydrolase [Variovorax sp. OV329]|uniref:HAD family hydrolase n=1 Tax=Variovorax sp. OV329 TaxID=1882825 RepID=UPI0008E5B4A0|nr:HAD-IA family hydrolase [Variovorax sp. OV329]SFM94638.1 putative hydrolase of the HAD superfamily [Variovorax sp. OV329]
MTLDLARIRAISLDLDDTLWPIRPTMERAEQALLSWLTQRAPRTGELLTDVSVLRALHEAAELERQDLAGDQIELRHESIRAALRHAGEDLALAEPAFDAFFVQRQQVTLYEDAQPALHWLSARYPLVAISNGNADLVRTGVSAWIGRGFRARDFAMGKPHRAIFHAAAQSLQLEPSEMLHVGDDAELDVLGAIDAGMQAAWLVRDRRAWEYDTVPHLVVEDLRALCIELSKRETACPRASLL